MNLFVLAILLLCVLLLLLYFKTDGLGQRDHWRAFARAHGFEYSSEPQPKVWGKVGECKFELLSSTESSDGAELGITEKRMSLSLSKPEPDGLEVREIGGLVGSLSRALEEQAFATNDEEFDNIFVVCCTDQERALSYLDSDKRAALLAATAEQDDSFLNLKNGSVYFEKKARVLEAEELEALYSALCELEKKVSA